MVRKLKVAILVAMLSGAGLLVAPLAEAADHVCLFYWSHTSSHQYLSRGGGTFTHQGSHKWDSCKGSAHTNQVHEH